MNIDTKQEFESWLTTAEFSEKYDAIAGTIDSADFFCSSRIQWLRDAWAAAQYAQLSGAVKVRLISDEWPDFEVQHSNGELERVEFTEADVPNRKRAEEYRNDKMRGYPVEADPYQDWVARRKKIPDALRAAVEKKARKLYGGAKRVSLLIYLNIGTYGEWHDEIIGEIHTFTAKAHDIFAAVFVLWNGELIRCERDRTSRVE
jgi:hypothetical protein